MGTFTQLTYQIVFGGKYRSKFLQENAQDQLFAYIGGILKNMGCIPYIVGGHIDHLHLVFSATGKYYIGKIVQNIKISSNAFMHDRTELFPDLINWQVGYGAFSYQRSKLNVLIEYVKTQKFHHETVSFKEEYIQLLEENGIEYDEKYLFI